MSKPGTGTGPRRDGSESVPAATGKEKVMLTRRQLLQRGAIGGAGLMVSRASLATAAPATVGATPKLRKWVAALPVPPVLDGRGGGKSFAIAARESTTWKFHPNLPATRTWGYWSGDTGLPYLGPTIEATRRPGDNVDTSVTIEWLNELDTAFLATVTAEGTPYIQHRGGPKGFVKIIDKNTIAATRANNAAWSGSQCNAALL